MRSGVTRVLGSCLLLMVLFSQQQALSDPFFGVSIGTQNLRGHNYPTVTLTNSKFTIIVDTHVGGLARPPYTGVDTTESYISQFIPQSTGVNIAQYFDANTYKGYLQSATATYSGPDKITVHLVYTGGYNVQDYTIYPDSPILRIDNITYTSEVFNWTNIVDLFNTPNLTFHTYGEASWIRPIIPSLWTNSSTCAYWDSWDQGTLGSCTAYTYPDVVFPSQLSYGGYAIMAYGPTGAGGRGMGRVIPILVGDVFGGPVTQGGISILKFLHVGSDGFEPYQAPGSQAGRPPFPSFLYLFENGVENAVAQGMGVADVFPLSGNLTANPATITVTGGMQATSTIGGGTPPYSVMTPPNGTYATASVSGNTLTVTGVAAGITSVVVRDGTATPATVSVPITVVAPLSASPSSITVTVGAPGTTTISGGTSPYSIQTAPNGSIATASMTGSTLTVIGVAPGSTAVVVKDATAPFNTVTVPITVNPGVCTGPTGQHYELPLSVGANGYARTNKVVEISINFTQKLTDVGAPGTFDPNSLRVVEHSSLDNSIIDSCVVFQFDRDSLYNAATNATGTLLFVMKNSTGAGVSRQYSVWFDRIGGGSFTAANFTPQVSLIDTNLFFQGQATYQIQTMLGSYFFHKLGGGLASLADNSSKDWISYWPGTYPQSNGDFRGIPNSGAYDFAHPGRFGGSSRIYRSGVLKTTVITQNANGRWKFLWEFLPTHARMTILADSSKPYWFLYEGTPNGNLDRNNGFWVRSPGGPGNRLTLGTDWGAGNLSIPTPRWAYFGDASPSTGTRRVFYMVHYNGDTGVPDTYWPLSANDGYYMTVFGFGRGYLSNGPYLTTLNAQFNIGFSEDSTNAIQTIDNSYRPLSILLSPPQLLPVQLASLSAVHLRGSLVRIDWSTISETNNYGFTVEKSSGNQNNFQEVPRSFVPGHGTTNERHVYSFTDSSATPGSWYYRVRQTDNNGQSHTTEGVLVHVLTSVADKPVPKEFAMRQNYPNPFNPSTMIQFDLPQQSLVKLEVYNVVGQRVAVVVDQFKSAGTHVVSFDASNLASGTYIYKLATGYGTIVKKMILMR